MHKQQSGFTLIELVMVIVILGILAATALPRFVNLQAEATAAADQGITGALRAATAIAYSTHRARNQTASVGAAEGQYITNCATLRYFMDGNAFPANTACVDGAGGSIVTLPGGGTLTLTAETTASAASLN